MTGAQLRATELASLRTEYGVPVSEARVRIALRAAPEPPVPAVPGPSARPAHSAVAVQPERHVPVPEAVPAPVPVAVPAAGLVLDLAPAAGHNPMAAPLPVPAAVLALLSPRVPEPSTEASVDDLIDRAREIDAEHRARRGRPASIRVLKRQVRIGQPKAEMVRTALDLKGPTL